MPSTDHKFVGLHIWCRRKPYYRSQNIPFFRTLYNRFVSFLDASGLAIGSICDTISSHFDSLLGDTTSFLSIDTQNQHIQ